MPVYSYQRQRNKEAQRVIQRILPSDRLDINFWEGNEPSEDGLIRIVGENRIYTPLKFLFQDKAINKKHLKKPRVVCETDFLNNCGRSSAPIFLFGVDIDNEVLYWEYLSSSFITSLKIKKGQKTKIIHLTKKITKNDTESTYLKEWESICSNWIDGHELKQQMEAKLQTHTNINQYTEKALNKFLYRLGKTIRQKNYDEIINDLNILDSLIYFKTENEYPIADFVIGLYRRLDANFGHQVVYKNPFGDLSGHSEKDFIMKYSELLEKIRYIKTDAVFNIWINLFKKSDLDKDIKEKIKKSLERLAEYNLFVLKNIGYYPQHTVLQVMEKWDSKTKLENSEIIVLVASKLLKSSFEGHSMTDYRTLTITTGALNPTKGLIKIRKRTLKLLENLYHLNSNLKERASILKTMVEVSYQPSQGVYGDDVLSMIERDIKNLLRFYRKIINQSEPSILQEIERQLAWFSRLLKIKVPQAKKLLQSLRKDELYSLYRLLVGREFDYVDDQNDFSKIQEEINKGIENILTTITIKNVSHYIKSFVKIARDTAIKEDWEFQRFGDFLQRLAATKPDVAAKILVFATQKENPISLFTGSLLRGLRLASQTTIIDKAIKKIITSKDLKLLRSIPTSLIGMDKKLIRQNDVKILCDIANHTGKFRYLSKEKPDLELRNLHYLTMRALTWIYLNDYHEVKEAIKRMLKRDKDLLTFYLDELSVALHAKRVTFKNWPAKDLQLIVDILIQVDDLDYQFQEILVELTKGRLETIISLLLARIRLEEKLGRRRFLGRYSAIPHHFYEQLLNTIKSHPKYPETVKKLIEEVKSDKKGGVYGLEVSRLIKEITKFDSVLSSNLLDTVKNGSRDEFIVVLRILGQFEGGREILAICLEIVKRTRDRKIWNECVSVFSRMGVVSGDHGISDTYRAKLEESKTFSPKNKSQIKFLNDLQHYLEKAISQHIEMEDKEIEEMKKEFEMEG